MTFKDLKKKWDKEKNYYRTQEVGSGVHSFVRACLENDEFFSLKAAGQVLFERVEFL